VSEGAGREGAGNREQEAGTLDPWLLAKLVCPLTRQPLRYDEAAQELISDAAGLAYPVRDGVPVMLIKAARRI
jgi:uncharacterized protein YbaR (Trm112 family)